ncbi:MAG: hypothetical protein ACRCZE_00705 [Candidatus Altimarinota bacterium]
MSFTEKFKNLSLEGKIKASLAYFEIFDLALSVEEVMRFMLGGVETKLDVEKKLKEMGNISQEDGFYVLKGSEKLLEDRVAKSLLADQIREKVDKWKWAFGLVPFVEMVCVCNYSSFDCVEKDSDIDLLIITKPGRIFLARVFLTFYMQLFGVRRHGETVAGRFCLSFYVNENNLNFEEILLKDGDIYFAYWMMALKPVYGPEGIWKKIELENKWIEKYFAGFEDRREKFTEVLEKKSWIKKIYEFILKGKFGNILEKWLSGYFLKRHAERQTKLPETASVIVSNQMLKFHNNDKRLEFKQSWKKRLKEVLND